MTALAGCGGGSGSTAESDTAGARSERPLNAAGMSVGDIAVISGASEARFTVSLDRPAAGEISVRYETEDGTALAGMDYAPAVGELVFPAGETVRHAVVELLDSDTDEMREFALRLTNVQGAVLVDAMATASIGQLLEEVAFDPDWPEAGVFSSANSCAACHTANGEVMTHADKDVSPPASWRHSMMGQSLTDPYFQAVVAEEVHLFPDLAGVIEDTCLTCHAPMAHTDAHQRDTASLDEDGNYRLETALRQMHAREGVSCTACHQIQDDGRLGTDASFGGQFTITGGQIFGPYTNPRTAAMETRTQYSPVYSAHMSGSTLCATCHTVFTPVIDVNTGKPNGQRFAEQTPYLEWRNSVYGPGRAEEKACQACHMPLPAEGYQTPIATRPDGGTNPNFPSRSPFRMHSFSGGNAHTLEIIKAYRDVLGIEASTTTAGFDEAIERTRKLLAEQTADLRIGPIGTDEVGRLAVPVTIVNRTGHKLPTAYPSRRMWVHLRVTDAAGQVVFESGRPDAEGRISPDAAHLDEQCLEAKEETPVDGCFEPHRDVIADPEKVAVYESVLGDVNGNVNYVLLQASQYLKDNRIPPRGFDIGAIPSDGTTAIIGGAEDDADFNRGPEGSGSDTVHYRIPAGDAHGPFRVEARLLYQAVRPSFIDSLHADAPRVERYKHMTRDIPPSVEILATAEAAY